MEKKGMIEENKKKNEDEKMTTIEASPSNAPNLSNTPNEPTSNSPTPIDLFSLLLIQADQKIGSGHYDEVVSLLNEKKLDMGDADELRGIMEELSCVARYFQEKKESAETYASLAWKYYELYEPEDFLGQFRFQPTCLVLGVGFMESAQIERASLDLPDLLLAEKFFDHGLSCAFIVGTPNLYDQLSELKSKVSGLILEAREKRSRVARDTLLALEEKDALAKNKKWGGDRKYSHRASKALKQHQHRQVAEKAPLAPEKKDASAKNKEESSDKNKKGSSDKEDSENKKGSSDKEDSDKEDSDKEDRKDSEFTDRYEIEMVLDKNTWKGFMTNHFGTFPKTFIPYTLDQKHDFQRFLDQSGSHETLLTITTFSTHPNHNFSPMLITEQVSCFSDYLEDLLARFFKEVEEGKKIYWWDFIKDIFHTLFRDLVVALTILYIKKHGPCGGLKQGFYVTSNGRGRLLPSATPSCRSEDDVLDFVSLMEEMLYPSLITPLFRTDLPPNILHCLKFLRDHRKLPLEYLLNHPCFWTPTEMIIYPTRLKSVLFMRAKSEASRSCRILLDNRFKMLGRAGRYVSYLDWPSKVKKGIFAAIWRKGDPNILVTLPDRRVLKSLGAIKVSSYRNVTCLVRYFVAALYHYFDSEYESLRPPKMSRVDVLEELNSMFPEFYTMMYEALGVLVHSCSIERRVLFELPIMTLNAENPDIHTKFVDIVAVAGGSGQAADLPLPKTGYVAPPAASELVGYLTTQDMEPIGRIVQMGFRWETALKAYLTQGKDVKSALEHIMKHTEEYTTQDGGRP